LSTAEIDRYVALGEWEGCAGAYRIEGRGQALFAKVEGDRTSVQGLPLPLLTRLLREAGVQFFYA
jgi:septum formation protein